MRSRARSFLDAYQKQSKGGDSKTEAPLAPLFLSICESSLPDSEKSVDRIAQEGFVMISAGGETTSRVLSMALFHIVTNPQVLERLQKEVTLAMPDPTKIPTVKELEELTYLVRILCNCHDAFTSS